VSDVKRLLDEATPRPWWELATGSEGFSILPPTGVRGSIARLTNQSFYQDQINAQLIVYAVNRLPDYEAAVDALERLERIIAPLRIASEYDGIASALSQARAALARLREGVPV
jgi:hypothetical protein